MDKKGKRFSDERDIKEDVSPVEETQSDPEQTSGQTEKREKEKKPKHDKDQRLKEKNAKKLDKLMKKQRRREKHSDREVLSYEDMPLEEREHTPHRSRFSKKKIIVSIVIVLVLFVVVFYATNADKLSFHNISNFVSYGVLNQKSGEYFPLDIKGENISAGNFIRKGQDICITSDTKTQVLNNYGKLVYSAQHAFITPVLVSCDNTELVYNLGGTGFQIISADGSVYNGEAADNILCGSVNKDRVYALVTQSSGYLSKLYVYNEDNEQIYAYSFSNYYVTSVSLNSTGKQAVVSGVSALDGVDIASIYVLDFTKDTPLFFSEFEGNIIYDIRYLSDKQACAVGRTACYAVNTGNGNVETYEYAGRSLTAYDINTDTDTYTVSLSGSGDGRNCDIVSFNSRGAEDKSFTINEKIIGLSTYKGRVALLSGDSVLLYSKDGGHYKDVELNSDPHAVAMYTSSDVYVLCTGYIDAVSM